MELQTLLVLCGVGVTGIAVLLLMGLFSTSGTSYEEAIAQQRKATTELLALAESKKPKKNNKKAIKKLAKKERKESNAVATGSDPESEAPAESGVDEDAPPAKPHVEFSPPTVVDISTDTPPNVKIRKRGKDPKVKPILINKEDPSCVSDPSTPPSPTGSIVTNHFEIIHPKDEFELLHSSQSAEKLSDKKEEVVEKKEGKAVKQGKGAKATNKQQTSEATKEEAAAPQRERRNSGEPPKEQRKAKKSEKKAAPEEVVEVEREEVAPVNVQPSEPVTEKPKQAPAPAPPPSTNATQPSGKNKKKKQEPDVLSLMAVGGGAGGVNVGELVRVVRDAALSRTEIQILTDALLNKHHDQLPEHSEWTEGPNDPMQKMKKQLADKEKALADEVEASQALHAKLKELRASLNAERGRAAALARAGEQAAADALALHARLQRLDDDNHALVQEKLMLQSKLSAEAEAQAQRVQLEMHIQRLTDSEQALVQQLAALQAEASARALEAGHDRHSLLLAQQHALELQQQLQEANRAFGEVEQQRAAAAHGEQLAQQELRQAQDRLAAMNDLQNEVQRATSRAQAAEANVEQLKEELEKQKLQLSAELSSLREQLALRETEMAELKQLKVSPAQNGLPTNTTDQHRAAELSKVESVVEGLRNELAAATRCSRDQRDQLDRLHDQLRLYQDKNNELRTKNWKIMEALQSAEKSLQTKSSAKPAEDSLREAISEAREAQYSEVAEVLRGACPAAAPAGRAGGDWLRAFADNLRALEPRAAPASAPDADTEQLRAQNAHLQAFVDKYKKIIDDTEGVLSSLQQNVTAEEQKWAQQLADKQRQLDELQQRTITQMQKKIDSLQEELQEVRSSNHNHSFADTERTTQERLMESLTDKHKVDVSNGPLQVDLGKI